MLGRPQGTQFALGTRGQPLQGGIIELAADAGQKRKLLWLVLRQKIIEAVDAGEESFMFRPRGVDVAQFLNQWARLLPVDDANDKAPADAPPKGFVDLPHPGPLLLQSWAL